MAAEKFCITLVDVLCEIINSLLMLRHEYGGAQMQKTIGKSCKILKWNSFVTPNRYGVDVFSKLIQLCLTPRRNHTAVGHGSIHIKCLCSIGKL